MKKFALPFAAILVLSLSTLDASAAVGGSNPRPYAVGGSNPRPYAVGGSNPRPYAGTTTTTLGSMLQAMFMYFGA